MRYFLGALRHDHKSLTKLNFILCDQKRRHSVHAKNSSADKKKMRKKCIRQKTSSVKIEQWKVVQNIKSCLGNLYSLKGKKLLSINNRHSMRHLSQDQNKQEKTTKETAAGFLINLKKRRIFLLYMIISKLYIPVYLSALLHCNK